MNFMVKYPVIFRLLLRHTPHKNAKKTGIYRCVGGHVFDLLEKVEQLEYKNS